MDIFHSVIFGVVEGVTEFLPISSTGHLILVADLLRIPQDAFTKSFEIIIQLGAITSVAVLYWRSFLNIDILKKLIVAFIPTGIVGLLLYKTIKTYLIGNETVVLWSFVLGGLSLIAFELSHKEPQDATAKVSNITYKQAVAVGVFQSIAVIPGVSRSAATIFGGLYLGFKRSVIVEFSFLLAVPTMLAASGLDIYKNYSTFSSNDALILSVGFIVSFVVALATIKFLLSYIREHNFIPFGIYRIAVAFIFWVAVL
ncbi:MAG: undecaprenyl-diphosphate phosphatase [Candidatus Taylorbacteria bacterium]|nr:undecaprenyl-diphosphate phosphatase [Candidatus Taylorbacteria bacterium]